MSEQTPHKRVFEYDGAFHCLDCNAEWGALPGNPKMLEYCDVYTGAGI